MRNRRVVIGTRGSRLARAQAAIVAQRLRHAAPHCEIEIRIVVTSGDRDRKSSLAEIGGKGIFIRELEGALLDGAIDIAAHSFKDVTTQLAPALALAGFLQPESVCDVMATRDNKPLEYLREGALIGTGSMRRKALLLRLRPDLRIAEIRGNIDTRLAKVERGDYDGIMLSEAGLIRLGLDDRIAVRFDPATFYPAPGQGVITLEVREDDGEIRELCAEAGDPPQLPVSTAELSLLEAVGFDCRTPLGIHTVVDASRILMRGFFVDPRDGRFREGRTEGPLSDPVPVGTAMAALLLQKGADR
ncbi:MAG: hydroxymethylbilane synthase [Chitinispirillaceae bacterium]|nr:hydroxymethylbilane synthase [Chitinispirillaceae bacterium]